MLIRISGDSIGGPPGIRTLNLRIKRWLQAIARSRFLSRATPHTALLSLLTLYFAAFIGCSTYKLVTRAPPGRQYLHVVLRSTGTPRTGSKPAGVTVPTRQEWIHGHLIRKRGA